MHVVVDTNVLISAVFFGGKPGQILDAWQKKKIELVISTEILAEYIDDDKFIAAAIACSSNVIITGDAHLLDVSGYSGIEMIEPATFIEKYLSEQTNAAEWRPGE